jgi:hypothetical protein
MVEFEMKKAHQRGALQEQPYPAMGVECLLLPPENNEAQSQIHEG